MTKLILATLGLVGAALFMLAVECRAAYTPLTVSTLTARESVRAGTVTVTGVITASSATINNFRATSSTMTNLNVTNLVANNFSVGVVSTAPFFSAYLSAEIPNRTGNGESLTVPFDAELADSASGFANSTYTVTAGNSGIWSLAACVDADMESSKLQGMMTITIVTTSRTYRHRKSIGTDNTEGGDSFTESICIPVPAADMSAGDQAYVTVIVQGAAAASTDADLKGGTSPYVTYFQGVKVR